jgi:hypothetical protein
MQILLEELKNPHSFIETVEYRLILNSIDITDNYCKTFIYNAIDEAIQ